MDWFKNDYSKTIILFTGCVLSTYFLPSSLRHVFFFLLLIWFYFDKNDYFWIAFVFFLVDPPGGFFPANDYNYGLPMYNLFPGGLRLIYFQELFIFIALFKAIKQGTKYRFYFRNALILLLIYFFFLFIVSFFLGFSFMKVLAAIRNSLPWTLIISFTVLIKNHDQWVKFFRLMFFMLIISVISQILYLILHQPPAYLLGTDFAPVMDYGVTPGAGPTDEMLRPISSPFLALIALLGSMIYLLFNGKVFNRLYLFLILGLSTFSIVITGTRGWIISYFVMLIIFILSMGISAKRYLQFGFVILIFLLVFLFSATIRNQVIGSFSRVETLQSFAKGDKTAQGTLSRVTEYRPHVLSKFYESPIFGWGFSDEYTKFSNGHVGNETLLLSVGILGFLLFIYFWASLCWIPIKIMRKLPVENPFRKSLLSIPIFFIGLFIIHSTSGQQFQFLINFQNTAFSQILFYSIANFFIFEALNYSNNSLLIGKQEITGTPRIISFTKSF